MNYFTFIKNFIEQNISIKVKIGHEKLKDYSFYFKNLIKHIVSNLCSL